MAPQGQVIIEAQNLTRIYSGTGRGVKDLSFQVHEGETVALLGLNGAGKSTTFKCLTGLLNLDKGSVRVCGTSLEEDRLQASRSLGYLPEQAPLHPDLTPREHLHFECRVRNRKLGQHFDEIVEICELTDVLDRPVRELSRGFRQRVGLANCLAHEPKLLLLDEPTASLDPHQVEQFRQLISKASQKSAIILSTHILAEVEALCSRCLILHEGELIESLPLPVKSSDQFEIELRQPNEENWRRELINLDGQTPESILAAYHKKGHEVRLFTPFQQSLEDHFLHATQERNL
jgi:ABC-2 type transport system ATP-binding protein